VDSRRAESFSDGVFAVAATLLVFNLLSIVKPGALTWQLLSDSWPSYIAYAVSFLTIGVMWLNHHGMLAQINRVDRPLLLLNLVLLLAIVALPFPTALVAQHLLHSGPKSSTVAVTVYGINMIFVSVAFGGTWLYVAWHAGALGGSTQLRSLSWSTLRFTAGNVVYVAGTLIARFVPPRAGPIAGLIIFGLVAVYYLFEQLPTTSNDTDTEALTPGG
jgi:uncharacterized membrane protein